MLQVSRGEGNVYRTRRRGVGFLVQAILPSGDGEFVVVNAVEPSHKRAVESLQVPTGAPGFVCLRRAAEWAAQEPLGMKS